MDNSISTKKTILIVFLISLVAIVNGIGFEGLKALGGKIFEGEEDYIANHQARSANEYQSRLPLKSDDGLTLTSVKNEGRALIFHYNLEANLADIDPIEFAVKKRLGIMAEICAGPLTTAINLGGVYQYIYESKDNHQIVTITLNKKTCGYS